MVTLKVAVARLPVDGLFLSTVTLPFEAVVSRADKTATVMAPLANTPPLSQVVIRIKNGLVTTILLVTVEIKAW